MSERYTKLFSLPEGLYAETSPVVIAAGALLKDNATGKVLAQLKFRNITGKGIKALRVSITPLDTMGAPLGEPISHQYLDLSAGRNDEFGQKVPVALPDAATRSCSVSVAEAIFSDNSLWTATATPWESLPAPVFLSSALRDGELEKQYRLKFGSGCQYSPMEHKDLWYCACGVLNTREDPCCHKCHNSLAAFRALDMDALKAERDERLAAEAQKAAEEKAAAEAQAKKAKKLAAIILPIVVAVIAAVVLVTQVILPAVRYSGAEKRLAAGDYDAAIEAFEALEDYKDSAVRVEEAEAALKEAENAAAYEEAVALLEAEDYAAAIETFRSLGDYKDSDEKCLEAADAKREIENAAAYANALSALENEEYEDAYTLFLSLGEYKDAQDYLKDFIARPVRIDCDYKYTNLYYDEAGRLIEEVSTGKSDPIHDSTTVYTYDADGNLIEEVHTFHTRMDGVLETNTSTTTYNADHTAMHFVSYIGTERDVYYTYDEHGNVLTEEIVYETGEPEHIEYSHTYADDGILLHTTENTSYGYVTEYLYEYDDDGKLILLCVTVDLQDAHHSEEYTEYLYDDAGWLIAEISDWNEFYYENEILYQPE